MRSHLGFLAIVVSVFGVEVAGVIIVWVCRNNCSKARCSSLNWPVDQRKLSNRVLIDHGESWLALSIVHGRVLMLVLVHGLKLSETVIRDQTIGVLFGLALDGAKGSR